jgi:hypothetical protein
MTHSTTTSDPPDISLLLRVYGEQRWLICEVFPVLREAEQPDGIAEQDLPAALAYLEMLWSQARRLARETDAAAALVDDDPACSQVLVEKARRYHAAVRRLRTSMRARVELVTAPYGPPLPRSTPSSWKGRQTAEGAPSPPARRI